MCVDCSCYLVSSLAALPKKVISLMRQPLSHGAVAHCSAGAWKSQFWMMKLVRLNQPQQSKMVCPLKLELFCTVRQLVRRKSGCLWSWWPLSLCLYWAKVVLPEEYNFMNPGSFVQSFMFMLMSLVLSQKLLGRDFGLVSEALTRSKEWFIAPLWISVVCQGPLLASWLFLSQLPVRLVVPLKLRPPFFLLCQT